MLITATILFALAALGGLTLAIFHFQQKELPMVLAVGHGVLAAVALVLLTVHVVGAAEAGLLTWALVLFVVAALGGFYLFSHHLRGRTLPGPVVIVHALAAVAAFVLLLTVLL